MMLSMLLATALSADPVCRDGVCYDPARLAAVRRTLSLRLDSLEREESFARSYSELADIRADIRQIRQQLWELSRDRSGQYGSPYVREYVEPPYRGRFEGEFSLPGRPRVQSYPDSDCPVCPRTPPGRPGVAPYDPYPAAVPGVGSSRSRIVRY